MMSCTAGLLQAYFTELVHYCIELGFGFVDKWSCVWDCLTAFILLEQAPLFYLGI